MTLVMGRRAAALVCQSSGSGRKQAMGRRLCTDPPTPEKEGCMEMQFLKKKKGKYVIHFMVVADGAPNWVQFKSIADRGLGTRWVMG